MIGIDLGTHSIKVVDGNFKSKVPVLKQFASFPMPFDLYVEERITNEDTFINLLKEIREKMKLGNNPVSLTMSGKGSIVRRIEIPYSDSLNEAVQFEAEQYLPYDISSANIDFHVLQKNTRSGRAEVLLCAMNRSVVDQIQHCFSLAKINLKFLEPGVVSLTNYFDRLYKEKNQSYCIVDCGASWTHFNVIHNNVPIYVRDLQVGGLYLTKEIARRMGLNNFEAEVLKQSVGKDTPTDVIEILNFMMDSLGNEVKRSLDFFQAQNPAISVQKVYVTGGAARLAGLARVISEALRLPLEAINPLNQMKSTAKYPAEYINEMVPIMVNACGAALR